MSPLQKIILCIVAAIPMVTTSIPAQTQPPHIEWAKSFGGSDIDIPASIERTSDHGFIVAGSSTSADQDIVGHHGSTDLNDFWIVKLDSNGSLLWQKSLGGSDDDLATSIKQTSDGGYVLTGHSRSSDGDVAGNPALAGDNYWILKLSENGNVLWQYTYGGDSDDVANDVEITADGGYIIAGYSYSTNKDVTGHHGDSATSDFWIVKLNHLGNLQWQRSYGGTGDDKAVSIRQTADRGYAAIGYSNSTDGDVTGNHGAYDYWIIKIDTIGNLQWEKSHGGSSDEYAFSFDQTTDHGYVLTGFTTSDNGDITNGHGQADLWMVKLDSIGRVQWQKSLGGSEADVGYSVKQTLDGGYISCGISSSTDGDLSRNQGGNDYWVIKLDGTGALGWQESIGGPGEDYANCIVQTTDSSYVIAGSSDFDGGDVSGNHDHEDYWVVKLSNRSADGVPAPVNLPAGLLNYPNPFNGRTEIRFGSPVGSGSKLVLYDLLGQVIRSQSVPSEAVSVVFSLEELPPGVYVYRLYSEEAVIGEGRMIVQ